MATIKNTFRPNIPGGGYEKELTLDNGEKYIIRNTFRPNIPGGGYEQEIVKKDDAHRDSGNFLISLIMGVLGIGYLLFIAFLFLKLGYWGLFAGVFGPFILMAIANNTIYKKNKK